MASIKIVLRTNKKKKDGTCPLAIRIIKHRKTRYVFTGKYIPERDWDDQHGRVKKSYENSARLNAFLRKKLYEAEAVNDKAELEEENLSSVQIKKKIKRETNKVSFFELACERIKNKYAEGTYSVANAELSILHNIQEFLNFNTALPKQKAIEEIKERRRVRVSKSRKGTLKTEEDLNALQNIRLEFDDINMAFINRFKSFCAAYLEQKTRTVTNQLIFIRTMYNQAIKENLVGTKNYPFGGEKERIRIGSGNKIGLTREEIRKIEEMDLADGTAIWHTRNVWLFAFYFAGVRISDVLEMRWSDFLDGRLYYQMNKNEKPVSLKIPEQAQKILSSYVNDKKSNSDFVFPFLKKANPDDKQDLFVKLRNATSLLNKYLKRIAEACGIEKNLSNHIARHSFGNIAGDKIHPLMLQKLYRHTDLKTTINYQANFIHKEADDALDAVIGL
ncbi:site-specific integrase [Algoriphagus sp. AGSA1]|uniref:tyrosine-type recombinase/integrase n=1 Tax=Algoriphagus sp. AGSA1 TaxID=2907213 RepID=UPI001F4234FB|nr:tyrosine-type recombinase/integrase [Algoriphagus sp. AGSA1]MCE7056901.1 site-specific integrase [Algoriphagus sp. AGSA1]